MGRNNWQYRPRKPRHQAAEGPGVQVELQRSAAADPRTLKAELRDLSRDGFRLRTPVALAAGESITVRVHATQSGLDLTLPATVRWRRAEPDESWSQGCLFQSTIDWETLGELFLNDVLATDGPAC